MDKQTKQKGKENRIPRVHIIRTALVCAYDMHECGGMQVCVCVCVSLLVLPSVCA